MEPRKDPRGISLMRCWKYYLGGIIFLGRLIYWIQSFKFPLLLLYPENCGKWRHHSWSSGSAVEAVGQGRGSAMDITHSEICRKFPKTHGVVQRQFLPLPRLPSPSPGWDLHSCIRLEFVLDFETFSEILSTNCLIPVSPTGIFIRG